MGPSKEPGLMASQHYFIRDIGILWDVMKLDPVNVMNIVLIPEIPNPTNMAKFRPINLCNFI
ncbi:hypothetical protein EPI10_020006 [Gossypium australe]|uniref:Uncharacterized protein n=1 Tax=Gossypium australe TaxID=47621 RepID=A0A5B6WFD7_9ROSI|nr:hypothetical protein EPI10_020006 [Gossypium australe]